MKKCAYLAIVLTGCSCTAGTAADAGIREDAATIDGSADGGASEDAAGPVSDAYVPSDASTGCIEATVGAWRLEVHDDVSVRYSAPITPAIGGSAHDLIVEMRRYDGVAYTGTFVLGAVPDLTFGECAHCVGAFPATSLVRGYFAYRGTLMLRNDPFTNVLDMRIEDVEMIEVAVEGPDWLRVPGGRCIHVEQVDVEQTFGPPGWMCPLSDYDDGTECDCRCGLLDPDCTIVGMPISGCDAGQLCIPIASGVIGPFFGTSICADDCDRGRGDACPAPQVCVDHYFGDRCEADAELVDAIAAVGDTCRAGAIHCAVAWAPDGSGAAYGYCDRTARADLRCRPRCNLETDCAAGELCSLVGTDESGPTSLSFGFCVPRAPDAWTCAPTSYGDGAICHCGCGTTDSDCALDPTLPIEGCASGARCVRGVCSGP